VREITASDGIDAASEVQLATPVFASGMMRMCSSSGAGVLDEVDLLVDVTLYPAAERRVELRQVAKLQGVTTAPSSLAERSRLPE
jgi:hypothetical protein